MAGAFRPKGESARALSLVHHPESLFHLRPLIGSLLE